MNIHHEQDTLKRNAELEKELVAKNHELEIEAALERVRSRTNAMHRSENLHDVITEVNDQLRLLGFRFDATGFLTDYSDKGYNMWIANFPTPLYVPAIDHKVFNLLKEVVKRGDNFFTFILTTEEKNIHFKNIFENTIAKNSPDELKEYVLSAKGMATSCVVLKNINLSVSNFASVPYTDGENEILKRFAYVFEQSYTRFLDLQKAEAQAKESQIQLALERVRARTMAMQHSDELKDAAALLFQQAKSLGVPAYSCGYNIWEKDDKEFTSWMSTQDGSIINGVPNIPLTEDANFIRYVESKQNSEQFFVLELRGERMQEHYEYLKTIPSFKAYFEYAISVGFDLPETQIHHLANFSHGNLLFITLEPCPEFHDVFKRFAAVFEQTYTRFLDLQKAEAQARESQIQLAMERVRARTMAMQKSDELADAAIVLFQQFQTLEILPPYARSFFSLIDAETGTSEVWTTKDGGIIRPGSHRIAFTENASLKKIYEAWKAKEISIVVDLTGKELTDYLKYLSSLPHLKDEQLLRQMLLNPPEHLLLTEASFAQGTVGIISFAQLTEEGQNILVRFAKVFELTYTRFLDLQKAEAQAREAQIEASLERIRSRTMGMQKSNELKDVATLLNKELIHLGITNFASCGYIEIEEKNNRQHSWLTNPDGVSLEHFFLPLTGEHIFDERYDAWKRKDVVFKQVVHAKELKKHLDFAYSGFGSQESENIGRNFFPDPTIFYSCNFSYGYLSLITGVMLDQTEELLLARFTRVFEQTYSRFLDLQKAEASAREAQIEAALERVRSRSMAMYQSTEMNDVAIVLFQQLRQLGGNLLTCGIVLCEENSTVDNFRMAVVGGGIAQNIYIPNNEEPVHKNMYEGWKTGKELYTEARGGEELKAHYDYMMTVPSMRPVLENLIASGFPLPTWQKWHAAYFSHGYLLTITLEPYVEEQTLKRFAKVFEQTYTRFLDLQKAEAQARESQIQLALERVRARTMAMQKSDELPETSYLLFQQVKELGLTAVQNSIAIINEETGLVELSTTVQGHHLPHTLNVPINDPYVMAKAVAAWKAKLKSLTLEFEGQELKIYNEHRNSFLETKVNFPEDQWIVNIIFFSKGWLSFSSNKNISDETFELLKRFAAVFEQTYTRFNDLKQAEEQARESQIQLALERVRARTMAMQKSDELMETAVVLFDQLKQLGEDIERTIIGVMNEEERVVDVWATRPDGSQMDKMQKFPIDEPILMQKVYGAWQQQKRSIVIDLQGEELEGYFKFLKSRSSRMKRENFGERRVENFAFFSKGMLGVISADPNTPANVGLYERFAAVFDQTYTRFLDLQRSEAQAREAQIEAALERVRSRSMGMQKSEELKEVIQVVYEQFVHLNINVEHTGFVMDYKVRDDYDIWIADQLGVPSHVTIPYFDCVYYNRFNEAKKKGEDFFTTNLDFEEKNRFYQKIIEYVHRLSEETKEFLFSIPGLAASTVLLENVCLYIENFSGIPFSDEENNTLMRFGKVFQQTYTRFLDLQKAEAQAREAIKQASVDRIRAEIASMRTTNDLERIQPLVWNELTTLGVPFTRCGVFIMDEEHEQVDTFLSTPDGQSIASFTSNYSDVAVITEALPYWRKREIYKAHWDEATFLAQAQTLLSQGNIKSTETYLTEHRPKDLYLHFLPFLQGILYVGNETPLNDEELQLVQNLADAFSIAYARYEDFNKLELAKEQIENTLTNLKQAQAQLVQSEKMASLGELTAGIAHEIQNPLNFVNNFSEVNTELIAEMKDEIEKGNIEGVKAIANDIADNEQKINHHGKRADAIVKGMLQHSRSSSGVKEPSDINVLADEYLRLAYHGLRAKDKSFNATMKTDYDETIGKINIVPQDVGRSVLNLITNAFYAVSEKKKQNADGYEPTVTVTTKRINGKVEISVSDNGNGISQKVLDKIFQPFFTTKPTGQGTGLGLSLSYDIVKAHNGELKVKTNEGEGSEFIIFLPANN